MKTIKTTFIYTLDCPITGEIKYVGKSNNPIKRYLHHLNSVKGCSLKINWIKSLKKQNKKPVLFIIDEVPLKEWGFWEKHWISLIKSWGFNLKNGTNGGDGTDELSLETRKRISESSPRKGKTYEEFFGKNKAKKLKQNISECNKKRQISQETREKQSKNNARHWKANTYPTESLKNSIKKNSHPILQYDKNGVFIKQWNSANRVKAELGFDNSLISKVAKLGTKLAFGFFWKIKEGDCIENKIEIKLNTKRKNLNRPILQYNLLGQFLKEYKSVKNAEKETGKTLNGFINNNHGYSQGYLWVYKYEDIIRPQISSYNRCVPKSKIILQFDLSGKFIKQFNSVKEAAKELNVKENKIYSFNKKKDGYAIDYFWRYKDEYDSNEKMGRIIHSSKKTILQYNLEGDFVKEWESLSSASKKLNININYICNVCKLKQHSAGGFMWKYKTSYNN